MELYVVLNGKNVTLKDVTQYKLSKGGINVTYASGAKKYYAGARLQKKKGR